MGGCACICMRKNALKLYNYKKEILLPHRRLVFAMESNKLRQLDIDVVSK